jgi:hypothetical protein
MTMSDKAKAALVATKREEATKLRARWNALQEQDAKLWTEYEGPVLARYRARSEAIQKKLDALIGPLFAAERAATEDGVVTRGGG